MILSTERLCDLLLRHWETLGMGEPAPKRFAFLMITKGREPVSKVVLLAFSDGDTTPRFAIKMPRGKDQNVDLEAEFRILSAVGPFATYGSVVIPKPLLCQDEDGWRWLVESAVHGTELAKTGRGRSVAVLGVIVDWLVHLGKATAPLRPMSDPAENLPALVARAARYVTSAEERRVLDRTAYHLRDLDAQPFPRVFEQRDMGPWNLLVSSKGTIGVVDWESSRAGGFPAWDLFYFLAHYGFMEDRSDDVRNRMNSFKATFWGRLGFAKVALAAVRRYTRELGLRDEWMGPLFAACWLHHSLSEVTRLRIRPSESAFWQMLSTTVDRDCRLSCSA